jgi:hypothetical protein
MVKLFMGMVGIKKFLPLTVQLIVNQSGLQWLSKAQLEVSCGSGSICNSACLICNKEVVSPEF